MNLKLGLTANHFYNAIVELCREKGISLTNCVFSEMDGCATNQGRFRGLKLYFCYHNGHHISESCLSHKFALLPQHLVVESSFEPLEEADKLALGLAAFFKASPLRTAVFENAQLVLNNKVLKLIAPSATRWLTHGQCFSRILDLFIPTLATLNSLYTDKDDFKAFGFMLGMINPGFQLSCLALQDVFSVMRLLTHWLQKSPQNAEITLVPILVKKTVDQLLYLAGDVTKKSSLSDGDLQGLKFTYLEFEKLSSEVDDFVKNIPAASYTRRRNAYASADKKAVYDDFFDEIFKPFAREMANSIENSLEINSTCKAFTCLDCRSLSKSNDLQSFGEDDLNELIDWYGKPRKGEYPVAMDNMEVAPSDPKINPTETRLEFETYKCCIVNLKAKFDKEIRRSVTECESKLNKITLNRNSSRDKLKKRMLENQIKTLKKKELTLGDIYDEFRKPEIGNTMPNIKTLLLLANLSPVGKSSG